MSLNTIALHPQLLADLYGNTLVETGVAPVPEPAAVKRLGHNGKGIILVVSNEGHAFLPDSELAFLTTILSACKLGLADIAILNAASLTEEALQQGIDDLEAKQVLLFGVAPLSTGLPINFPQFQLQQFNKRTYLYGPSLAELERDKLLKQQLWGSLKTLFAI